MEDWIILGIIAVIAAVIIIIFTTKNEYSKANENEDFYNKIKSNCEKLYSIDYL